MSRRWGGRRSQQLVALTLATYGSTCHLCRQPGATTADHIIPRARGGTDSIENLRPAHRSCNSARQDMPLAEWYRRHPIADPAASAAPSREWL